MHSIYQIAEQIKADWLQQQQDAMIEHLLIDSRKLIFPASTLFFALRGPRRNGNIFIEELYAKGLRNFVLEEGFEKENISNYPAANFLLVKDALQALHLLVAFHRKQFQLPVIGITGSNGKTIVKEWLYQLLHKDYNITRSPKSYNSQIGVPLSVWQINQQHNLGIFEAGISQPNEMEQLEKMIVPTIGIFTNIGDAHSEGFLNIRQKINEKLQLFVHCNLLIYGADNSELHQAVITFSNKVKEKNNLQLFTWGSKDSNDLQIFAVEKKEAFTSITGSVVNNITFGRESKQITIPFTDDAAIENAINCWCVLLNLNIPDDKIAASMQQLRTVEMRLELKKGINNCSVINDSYSVDINSLNIALDFLAQQQQHPNRTLILSDILQSGKSNFDLYCAVAEILQQKYINRFIGIGPEISRQQVVFKHIPQTQFFQSVADFKAQFHAPQFLNETILLKGARVFEFEQISQLLEEKTHQTLLEINLSSITHNLKKYQQLLQPGVQLMAMVKAFSYGSGSFEIANLLQFHKVDYLAVAFADEGVELRKAGISLPIMVMSPEAVNFENIVQYNLEPELFSFGSLQSFIQYITTAGIEYYPVHIKIDTGMHRLGFEAEDMALLTSLLQHSTKVKIQSVLSHLAASDNAALDYFTQEQAAKFICCCSQLQQAVSYSFIRHLSNTSAIMRHGHLQFDMVRLGIGLYGIDSNSAMQAQLKNVTTLKTTVAQVRKVKAGDTIGYGRAGVITEDSLIATVRIGYADGYPRLLGNGNGKMLVNGALVPVIGNICMDMTMLNVTGLTIAEGDEVIVFGEDLPVANLAKWANTISYEILTGISQRVKRVYFEE
jgi:alanine racemase